ncbi:5'-methylthioadenosine/adenosylhomocysteine nucleosidase [Helicobacter saguini]|uniref:adenosylhomocysteine nucleosidase n=1 Tax=Helicobacter saguini TaxID=1548018 RepID=A0A347VRA7_9HELI|nr:5'-methylthioadenosine/adenosylhomocysteine nucleosidase [Helicobacter saguini]MWV62974.1 5'-methylthioadenosine/adenosylhomocysteine nucleosidase [Helicobacter saguini]MWV66357.1 5'-methylthioadenosine/adenosylhomocysteine nucleosidase [Helicobacter saguini]MWV68709.1 5'-methylthioadenosine/adenosylhomocysteine nucleosidase [Helicobacter saguini]MWV71740.1 5'-methylthioadenosine/adenosylhomocysteine nucleosidase [Helicobacter saguini]TLD92179.1 5'-methylthioadenosine/adenosylhomocysteine n
MKTIGIMGAMNEEITPLLEIFGNFDRIELGGNTFYKVEYSEKILIIAYSKIGKVHAAITATTMILHFGVECIIFSGVAGGISSDLKVGDLLLATRLVQHDVDITAFGHAKGFIPEGQLFYDSDVGLCSLACDVASEMGLSIKKGIVASGDQFIASKEVKDSIAHEFKAIAVEMEGAAVACVCYNFKVPFCIFRSISDSADGEASVSFDKFLESSAKTSAQFVSKLVDRI